ncbi:hypothetical protein BKA62DRAFT_702735 [Auriculariales sp. MPI-PUGE-AT-0066]|nr:hypothetical protein BKA62DRAFT_702735 [Auriculariales sp. MPI-PUGE-AT-0066]
MSGAPVRTSLAILPSGAPRCATTMAAMTMAAAMMVAATMAAVNVNVTSAVKTGVFVSPCVVWNGGHVVIVVRHGHHPVNVHWSAKGPDRRRRVQSTSRINLQMGLDEQISSLLQLQECKLYHHESLVLSIRTFGELYVMFT